MDIQTEERIVGLVGQKLKQRVCAYVVLTGLSRDHLKVQVEELLELGWEPRGGVAAAAVDSPPSLKSGARVRT